MKMPRLLKGAKDVVLDTMVYIYLFEDAHKSSVCEYVINEIANGKFSAVVTPITCGEILAKPLAKQRNDIADTYRRALLSMTNIRPVSLEPEVGFMAGALRSKYGLPLPDMLQVAIAMQGDPGIIITNDKDLSRVSEVQAVLLDEFG